jgi:AraC family transcriptional regulator
MDCPIDEGLHKRDDYMEPWQARCVQGYISVHLQTKINIGNLARVAQFSHGRFKRAFRASFGCAPRQYVIRMRIERAQHLMSMCGDSLRQIAAECGFTNPSHFSDCFSRVVGERPGAWRARRALTFKSRHPGH